MYKFYTINRVLPPGRMRKILLVMKLTTLLMITVILQVSAKTFAQKITLSDKDASLVTVFNQIRTQSGYDFLFTTSTLKDAKPVTIDVKNEELSDVLTQIFAGQPLDFSIENKSVVVHVKTPSLLDKAKAWYAQVTVLGKVTDELGDPMPGVTVKEKGTENVTVTGAKGTYSIMVMDDKSIILFSYIGYETQELAAKDIANGSVIKLKPQPQNLQEVVINKGYYSEKQELSTGDVSMVDAKTIEEQPVSDPIQALIGRVPGLNIQQTSGIPGAYATIIIRGISSIANGHDPYYIVDGVPFSSLSLSAPSGQAGALGNGSGLTYSSASGISPFSALNPDDIENIEVLKDADATAIYGTKGANGVILITTKKGKAGETKVSVDLSQGIGQVAHFMSLLNTQQYLQMMHQAYTNDGLPFPTLASAANDGGFDVDGVWDTTRYTNWQKVLIGNTAHYTNTQASISGGNTNTQFLIGAGYYRSTTVYPGDFGDQKGSLHFSLTNTSSNQKFKVLLSASYVNDNNDEPFGDLTNAVTLAPDAPALYNPNGSLNWQLFNGTATFNNPLAGTLNSSTAVTNNLVSNLNLSYQLLPGLLLSSSFGYGHDEMNQTSLSPASSEAPPNNTNPYDRQNTLSINYSDTWNIEPQLSYQKTIGKGQLNALLGGTLEQNSSQYYTTYAEGFSSDALIDNQTSATAFALTTDQNSLYRYEALVGRVGYTWEDKYLINLTGNRDGSSRFGPGHQYGNFGSVGAGWIFSKEKAIQNAVPWLNFGKLRVSYGTTGNDQIGNYQYLSTYSLNSTSYQAITELNPTRIGNPNYSWELDKKLEAGLDLGFLNDRIDLSASYYRNRTGNQLVGYPLPSFAGFSSVQFNLPAVVQNTGLEATLHTVNIKTSNFNWTTSVNFTLPNNKLVSYPGIAGSSYADSYVVGQSLFIHRVYEYTGVDPQTGLYTFKSSNGTAFPNYPGDLVTTPAITQKYYGGIGNDVTYKGFGLDVFVQFVKQLGLNSTFAEQQYNQPGTFNYNQLTSVLGAWTTPGQAATVQRYGIGSNTFLPLLFYGYSNAVYSDNSFIRLKNVEFYYRLPPNWQQWAHMQNARIYIQGQNLYTFTHYKGLDPETGGLGLPPLRVIMMGISASF